MDKNPYAELIDRARRSLRASDHFDAAAQFHEAAMAARQGGMTNECAYALRHCAISEIENGNFAKALSDSKEALALYGSLGDTESLNAANTQRLMALAHEGLGQLAEATECWKIAREIYEQQDIEAGLAECDEHLGSNP